MKQLVGIVLLFTVFYHASHGFLYIPKLSHSDHEGVEDLRLEFPQPSIRECDDPDFKKRGSSKNLTVQTNFPPHEDTVNIISLLLKNLSLTRIPDRISKLKHLQCLDLEGNKISPTKLLPLHNSGSLKSLFLNNQSPRKKIGGIFPPLKISFPKLRDLDVSGSHIQRLATTLANAFPDLRYLNLSNNNLSSTFFSNAPLQLSTLILKNTDIRYIILKQHRVLYSLFLDNNHYPEINFRNPKNSSLMVVGIKNVTHLSLSNCSIQFIHNWCFQRAAQLSMLDLSFNNLRNLTAKAISIPSLISLSLSHNHLENFPKVMRIRRLNSLFLSYNNFSTVPLSINNHPMLEILTLRGNRLKAISDKTFAGLKYLRKLDLAENQFASFEKKWTLNLNHLEYLNLNSNGIKEVEDMHLKGMQSLKQLLIRNNSYGSPYGKISNSLPFHLNIFMDELHSTDEEQNDDVITFDADSILENHF